MRTLLLLLSFVTIAAAQVTSHPLLSALQGEWTMRGRVMGDQVTYDASGAFVLMGGFFTLAMKDSARPPQYEAVLSIGIDTVRKEFVAHWLDSFGGPGARVVGFGPLSDSLIELHYPYASAPFRNRIAYHAPTRRWTFLIESQGKDGGREEFGSFTLVRARR